VLVFLNWNQFQITKQNSSGMNQFGYRLASLDCLGGGSLSLVLSMGCENPSRSSAAPCNWYCRGPKLMGRG
jgi:hypothetical protein